MLDAAEEGRHVTEEQAVLLALDRQGGRMAARLPPKAAHLARAMIVEIALIGLATLPAIVFDTTPDHFSGDLVIGLLAFAVGTRNATVRRLKVADLSTTVLTRTLTGLAADLLTLSTWLIFMPTAITAADR